MLAERHWISLPTGFLLPFLKDRLPARRMNSLRGKSYIFLLSLRHHNTERRGLCGCFEGGTSITHRDRKVPRRGLGCPRLARARQLNPLRRKLRWASAEPASQHSYPKTDTKIQPMTRDHPRASLVVGGDLRASAGSPAGGGEASCPRQMFLWGRSFPVTLFFLIF